jgi:hypothetical protein
MFSLQCDPISKFLLVHTIQKESQTSFERLRDITIIT